MFDQICDKVLWINKSVNVASDLRWPMAGVSCEPVRVWRGASELIGGSGSAGR